MRPLLLLLLGALAACTAVSPPPANPPATAALPTRAQIQTLSPLPTAILATTTAVPSPTVTLAPTPSPTSCPPGVVAAGQLSSRYAGEFTYRLYTPPCYGENGRLYPALYLLPGNVHDETIWDELGIDETADALIRQGAIPPLLIVMADGGPLANNTSGGPGSYESVILEELIPHVEAATCAWAEPAGRAIGGLSRGGYWALEIAFRHPDHFASAGGHSAALLDQYAGPAVNPQHTGPALAPGALRIYLDIGGDDYVIANTRRLHDDLTAAGVQHEWVLNDGGHDETYWQAHLAAYLRWYGQGWPQERASYPLCSPP